MPRVLVVSQTDGSVTFFDPTTRKRLANVKIGGSPRQAAIARNGRYGYVTRPDEGGLSVLDLMRLRETERHEQVGLADPAGLVVLPDGRSLLLTSADEPRAVVYDLMRRTALFEVALEAAANGRPAVERTGGRAWVALPEADAVVAIGLRERRVIARVPVPGRPLAVAMARDGRKLVVTRAKESSVLVIDPDAGAEGSVLSVRPVGQNPAAVSVHDYRDDAFVVSKGGGSVFHVDLNERIAAASASTEDAAPDGGSRSMSAQGSAPASARPPIATGLGACDLTLAQGGKVLYVANHDADTVSIIDVEKQVVRDTWQVPSGPVAVVYA